MNYRDCKPSDVAFRPSDGLIVRTDYDSSGKIVGWSEFGLGAAKELVSRFQAAIDVAEIVHSKIEAKATEPK